MSGSMLLTGFFLTFIIKNNYEESTKLDFNNYYERAKSTFKKIEVDTLFYSNELSNRSSIKNALNLISEYSDINNYQANIYDEEKKNIARILLNYAKSSHLHEIRIYDKNGWLAAFSRSDSASMGIVSFIKGKPIILVSENNKESWNIVKDKALHPNVKLVKNRSNNRNNYIHNNEIVGNESVSKIYRTYRDGKRHDIGEIYV